MRGDFDALTAYPIALVSAAAFYLALFSLLVPQVRALAAPILGPSTISGRDYLPGFDTFRGFAAAIVALGHGWWATYPVLNASHAWLPFLPYAAKGVPIFCVLSGFLIYRSVLAIDSLGELRAYAIRRFFRIYPVYFISVVLCLLAGQYGGRTDASSAQFFFADVFMFRILWWPAYANPVTWSLYIEAAFYVALPLVVLVVRPQRMALFALLGIVAMTVADHASRDYNLWRYFLYGILAAELSPYLKRGAFVLFLAGAVLLGYDLLGPAYDLAGSYLGTRYNNGHTVGIGIACALLLASLPHLPRTGAALNVAPLRLMGVISYSLYVTHIFFILANFPVLKAFPKFGTQENHQILLTIPTMPVWYLPLVFFPGMLAWALVTYVLIERPGIALGRHIVSRSRRKVPQPAE